MQQFPPFTIRPMVQADIPAVVAIDRLSFPTPWPASSYLYELGQNHRSFYYVLLRPASSPEIRECLPAERGWRAWLRGLSSAPESLITGYLGLRLENGHTHISTLAVHPDWRGRSLGETLLLTAVLKTREIRLSLITLEVRASNTVAQQLYLKYGFGFVGVHPRYYRGGEDAWLMQAQVGGLEYGERLAALSNAVRERLQHQVAEVGQNAGCTL